MSDPAATRAFEPSSADRDELLIKLASLVGAGQRREFFKTNSELVNRETVGWLKDAVLRHIRIDPQQAMTLAEVCLEIAQQVGEPETLAHGLRTKANALYAGGDHKAAIAHHRQAIELYRSVNNEEEVARTLSASIQPHLLLGEYDEALAAADKARQIFEKTGNRWRIARLDINVGNIYHRQDRFEEALGYYQRASKEFLTHFDVEGTAAALSNIATCQITLNDFARALKTYEQARAFCQRHGMPALVAQSDYNIAWLYYLRGEYGRAIQMLHASREACRKHEDKYHFALCHMDLSEIYLDLNLSQEAMETARAGADLFEKLGMGYEHAKCLANLGIATGQQSQTFAALELLLKAREIFVREQNAVWPSLLDLYQAVLLSSEGRLYEARRLCSSALEFFDLSALDRKAALAHVLMSRLKRLSDDLAGATRECSLALSKLEGLEAPKLSYEAHLQMGELLIADRKQNEAYNSFRTAQKHLESIRGSVQNQELKIALMKNRLVVYERLAELCLERGNAVAIEEAFHHVEQSKSRALMDLMLQNATALPRQDAGQSSLVQNIRDLREELNWYYHRIEQEQLRPQERSPERLAKLQQELRKREEEFLRAFRDLSSEEVEAEALQPARTLCLEEIRAAIPADTTLLEYFRIGDRVLAATLSQTELKIATVTLESRLSNLLRFLQFQLSKFQLGTKYVGTFSEQLLATARAHLKEFYDEVLAPLAAGIKGNRLIIVPHGVLHYLPFHALYDGDSYVSDRFSVSYSPSASIFALCATKAVNRTGSSLVFGVADEQAPFIREEATSVAEVLPNSQLFLDAEARVDRLRQLGPQARFVHIATHGSFRQDNPMFSGVRMGDSYLSLYDLYNLKLPAELVVLSGCATGLTVVAEGDELLGLVRGLLHAGAKSLVLSLWNVHDRSATELIKGFYTRLQNGQDKAAALQAAMNELRREYPHPYYWAPFKLVGSIDSATY